MPGVPILTQDTKPHAYSTEEVAFIRVFVPGKAVGKQRPRVVRRGDYVQAYTPQATVDWQQNVAEFAKIQLLGLSMEDGAPTITLPFENRVIATMTFWMTKPKSYPKSLTDHLKKPDVDNLGKSVLDALEHVGVISKDQLVTDLLLRKRYTLNGEEEGVEIELTGWL